MRNIVALIAGLAVIPATAAAQDPRPTFVIIGMGDSYAAGEGAPEVEGRYALDGAPNTIERWTDTSDAGAFADAWRCHRSPRAGAAVAADSLRARYPGIRFVFASFACSGARADSGIIGPFRGADNRYTDMPLLPSQIEQAEAFLGARPDRRLDAIVMNIGGNDAGFAGIIGDCLFIPEPVIAGETKGCESFPPTHDKINGGLAALGGANGRFARIDQLFQQRLAPVRVYLTEVPNPARGSNGQLCHRQPPLDLYSGATRDEARYIETTVVGGLNDAFRAAAARAESGNWEVVGGIAAAFRLHGICAEESWFRNNATAMRIQGPETGAFTAVGLDGERIEVGMISSGFVHPNPAGYRAIARRILVAVDAQVQRRFTIAQAPRLAVDSTTEPSQFAGMRRTATTIRSGRLARPTGTIALSWTDPSPDETIKFVLAVDERDLDVPAGTTSRVVHADGKVGITIRACSPIGCGPRSDVLVVSNIVPGAPTALRRVTSPQANQRGVLDFAWSAADAHQEYFEVKYEAEEEPSGGLSPASGTPVRRTARVAGRPGALAGARIGSDRSDTRRDGETVVRVPGATATLGSLNDPVPVGSGYTVQVRACSTAGCSEPAVLTVDGVEALPPAPPRR